jgi:hypothetical protein
MGVKKALVGFDTPISLRTEDHLNRWSFAREIYQIATEGSETWPVRIGIYGDWGSGKTSILGFIESMAEKSGHVVVWFNPWEYSTSEQLWQGFINIIYDKLEQFGIKVPYDASQKVKTKDFISKLIQKLEGFTIKGSIVSWKISEISFLRKWASFGTGDLPSISKLLRGKRFIFLIDDLDRADPKLVPQILFVTIEILNLPGFSFILAFDPVVVGAILGEYHCGWENGLQFLEKIVEFPRWLPPPEQGALLSLALSEIHKNCPFVDLEAFKDVFNICPTNPRRLKLFIRQLRIFKEEIERYDPDEINWNILILINLLKAISPGMVHNFFDSEGNCKKIELLKIAKDEKRETKIAEVVTDLIKYDNSLEKCRNDIHKIIEHLINSTRFTSGQLLFQNTFLSERQPGNYLEGI